ncbi:hypothetical protein AXA65_18730 [Chryseobacterium sp. FP211-J200]|nr:hypothetical protein AXA65_18730 [Chryseobacterium sp. FP211-J200]
MNNQYRWNIETTADEGYHMEILSGGFYDQKGEEIAGIQSDMRLQSGLLGDSGSITVENYRAIPSQMNLEWFSYAEDKFFKGKFQLDIERIKSIFHNTAYQGFKIAPIPGGRFMLYAYAEGSTELFRIYKGQEVQVTNFKEVMRYTVDETRSEYLVDFRKSMPLQTQQEIASKSISLHIWDDISIKYPWKYTVQAEGFDKLAITMQKDEGGANFIDAEEDWKADVDYYTTSFPKPIPTEIDGKFETPAGRAFTIRIYPGNSEDLEFRKFEYVPYRKREQELVKQFKDFYEKIGKQEFEIHLRMSEDFKTGKVYLKKGNIMEEIPNTDVLIFDTTFGK